MAPDRNARRRVPALDAGARGALSEGAWLAMAFLRAPASAASLSHPLAEGTGAWTLGLRTSLFVAQSGSSGRRSPGARGCPVREASSSPRGAWACG